MEVENNYKQSSDFQVYYFIKQEQSWGNNKGYYNNSAGYKKGNVIQFFNLVSRSKKKIQQRICKTSRRKCKKS